MKIDFLGNLYLQPYLHEAELNYLQAFSSSCHFHDPNHRFMGLYDLSVSQENLLEHNFVFNKDIDLVRSASSNIDNNISEESILFPFFHSPIHFTQKAIKFSFMEIKNKNEFIFNIEHIAKSMLFYYDHFLKENCHSKVLDKEFFSFFQLHSFSGHVYFKLSEFGEFYKLSANNEKIVLLKGKYTTQIRGKDYTICSTYSYDKNIKQQLDSFYKKLSIIDIKKNALFEEEGAVFSLKMSEQLQKMLHFHSLNHKLQPKLKDKIHKI